MTATSNSAKIEELSLEVQDRARQVTSLLWGADKALDTNFGGEDFDEQNHLCRFITLAMELLPEIEAKAEQIEILACSIKGGR